MSAKTLLEIPGEAADHLYREGSAKASFWEAVFGSSLRAARKTRVSSLEDGTRRFDVPLRDAERKLLDDARRWLASPERAETFREAAAALSSENVRVTLVGLQPRGQAVASFVLRFEQGDAVASPAVAQALRTWFKDARPRLAREVMIPFGFTPHPEREGSFA